MVLEVEEGEEVAALHCSGMSSPEASVTWLRGNEVVADQGELKLPTPVSRWGFSCLQHFHIKGTMPVTTPVLWRTSMGGRLQN